MPPAALAVQVCELNGQHVNPSNGSTTEGKTGLMRCREGEGGPVVREQELQQGKFMGVVRYFKDGALEREYRVNERGNRDGLSREWARAEAGGKSVLVREETLRDSRTVGIARSWYPSGQLRRVAFHGDEEREQASAEFTSDGRLAELRCAHEAGAGQRLRRQGGVRLRRRRLERHAVQRQGRGQGAASRTSAASGERARRSGKAAASAS